MKTHDENVDVLRSGSVFSSFLLLRGLLRRRHSERTGLGQKTRPLFSTENA